jgi:hypothetical protein
MHITSSSTAVHMYPVICSLSFLRSPSHSSDALLVDVMDCCTFVEHVSAHMAMTPARTVVNDHLHVDIIMRLPSVLVLNIITGYMNGDDGWYATCVSRGWFGIWCNQRTLWTGRWQKIPITPTGGLPFGIQCIIDDDRKRLPRADPSSSLSMPQTMTAVASSSSLFALSRGVNCLAYPWRSRYIGRYMNAITKLTTPIDRTDSYQWSTMSIIVLCNHSLINQLASDYHPDGPFGCTEEGVYVGDMVVVDNDDINNCNPRALPPSSTPSTTRQGVLPMLSYDQLQSLTIGTPNGDMKRVRLDLFNDITERYKHTSFSFYSVRLICCKSPCYPYEWDFVKMRHQQCVSSPFHIICVSRAPSNMI